MAHHVYQTEALVLRGVNIKDANRFVDVFSRDLGLVRAVATSARRERSKMRYSLQDYSHLDVSLVRGRQVWRITGARERGNVYYKIKHNKRKLHLFKKVNTLLTRLLHGEEKNEELFNVVLNFITHLEKNDIDENNLINIECLVVMRILYTLGYVARDKELFETNEYTEELLKKVENRQKKLISLINSALKESQL